MRQENIATKELIPIILAAACWGSSWKGAQVQAFTDNAAVVEVINKFSTTDPALMHLVCCLHFFMAHYEFAMAASHVPGRQNQAADALSRDNQSLFFSLLPQAHPQPSHIPHELVHLLVLDRPDWTSKHWSSLFAACTVRV